MRGGGAVVVRRTRYPQVVPRAADLVQGAPAIVLPRVTVAEAERLARRRRAPVVAARLGSAWGAVGRETLAEALRLGLGDAPVDALLWGAPAVPAGAPEVAVRRRLGPACPVVLVADARGPRGVALRDVAAARSLPLSLRERLAGLSGPVQARLRHAGAIGDTLGVRIALVGGLVRDLLLGRVGDRADLDLAVEGDAPEVARRLARALGGRAVEHPAFLTATVVTPEGGRVDLATARRERYRAPGALPAVEPASLGEDLARRDFSINALAVRLDGAARGALVDPTGGLADLRARRLRVLHPLSFVEDPTRIFRAARFAVRLGCRVDRTTRRLAARAAALDVYAALSGDRLRVELELALAEAMPVAALVEAARLGAWRLIVPGARVGATEARLLAGALAPPAREGLGAGTGIALAVLGLAGGSAAAEAAGDRLALPPALRAAIRRARADGPALLAGLRGAGPGAAYALLRGVPEVTVAWARALAGPGRARRHLDLHRRRWRSLRPLAGGDDLAALGVPPGPAVGRLLRGLLAAQAAGRVGSRGAALRWLAAAVARRRAVPEASLTRSGRRGG